MSTDQGDDSRPVAIACRRILSEPDLDTWLHSKAYRDYLNFIKQLNDFARGVHNNALKSREELTEPCLVQVMNILDDISALVDKVEPFEHDANQR